MCPRPLLAAWTLALVTACADPPDTPVLTPADVVDELLAADRGFSLAGRDSDMVSGLTAMFTPDVVMPLAGGAFANGIEPVAQALRANPTSGGARAEWAPIRGGVSADGLHGFTLGYLTVHRGDSSVPLKYLAYWIRGVDGWRVAAYKMRARPAGAVSTALMPPALPTAIVPPGDSAAVRGFEEELAQAERDFSRDAQVMGLGPAFARYGSPDAMNIGGPGDTSFVIGNEAIARSVSAGGPATGSAVSWGPDRVLVASSGDLGVSIGVIEANAPAADGSRPRYSFFTVWHRTSPSAPWRYIAE